MIIPPEETRSRRIDSVRFGDSPLSFHQQPLYTLTEENKGSSYYGGAGCLNSKCSGLGGCRHPPSRSCLQIHYFVRVANFHLIIIYHNS